MFYNKTLQFLTLLSLPAWAAPEFAPVFQSEMLLQRDKAIPVWGTAEPKSKVTISWQGKSISCTADSKGKWQASLPATGASADGQEITATDSTGTTTLSNVIVGDLWLASGQSNMEWVMNKFSDGKNDVKSFNYPDIRMLDMKTRLHTSSGAYRKADYDKIMEGTPMSMQWKICTPQNAGNFSAAAAYFAQAIHLEEKVPVGIICNAVGGSGMEAWMPPATLKKDKTYAPLIGKDWLKHTRGWAGERANANLKSLIAEGEKPESLVHPFKAGFLFEAGNAPLTQLPIKGVIWYQGETNADNPDMDYNKKLLKQIVTSWRQEFKQENLPFYMVQLPRIKDSAPLRALWAQFREIQLQAADELPGVEIACILELGQADSNVHPSPKGPVGKRLAMLALEHTYGKPQDKAPRIKGFAKGGKGVSLQLTQAVKCTAADGVIKGFQVKKGNKWEDVQATADGNKVTLTDVKGKPQIRYNYSTFCEPNLVSEKGELPVFPWRNDKDK